jgi:hypothetical protein
VTLEARVQFSSTTPNALEVHVEEHSLGKGDAVGSNPIVGTMGL